MRIHWPLIQWFLRPRLPWAAAAGSVAGTYALFRHTPLYNWRGWIEVSFIIVAVYVVGRPAKAEGARAAFLYTRGYSKDAIWSHALAASAMAVGIAWLAPAVIVWSGLRSVFQDNLLMSPYYPVMWAADAQVTWWWLVSALILLPALYYSSVRTLQPTRGVSSGVLVEAAAGMAWLTIVLSNPQQDWFWPLAWAAAAVAGGAMLYASRRLHRTMEVRQCTPV